MADNPARYEASYLLFICRYEFVMRYLYNLWNFHA